MTDPTNRTAVPDITMSLAIIEPAAVSPVPVLIAAAGEPTRLRFIEFFTSHIRNPNTRAAYGVAEPKFFGWLELSSLTQVSAIRTIMSRLVSRC